MQKFQSDETACEHMPMNWKIQTLPTEVGECFATRDMVQLGTWLDHIRLVNTPKPYTKWKQNDCRRPIL